MIMKIKNYYIFLVLALISSSALATLAIPDTDNAVNDYHGVLTIQQKSDLTKNIDTLREQNGAEIVVLVVSSVFGEAINQYTFHAMEAWERDHRDRFITVFMVVNAEDASYFIGTSPAIQHVLPDEKVTAIADEIISPYWVNAQWYEGIDAGVSEIINIVEQEAIVNSYTLESAPQKAFNVKLWFLVFSGCIYILFYLSRWLLFRSETQNYLQHVSVFLLISIALYFVVTDKTELEKLLVVQPVGSEHNAGIKEAKAVTDGFDAQDYIMPGLYTVLYFYSDTCPGCRRLNADIKLFSGARKDVVVRKFNLGDKWSGDDAYNTYRLKIGKTPFIHIYGPSGELIAEDVGLKGEGLDLLYEWMNAVLAS